jgi:RNA polymerase sigma-70 factor, ECF subfamily
VGDDGHEELAQRDLAQRVAAAQDGDPDAFSDLVRATYNNTYSLALRLTGNDQDAKDVAQDTYLRAFRALTRFRGDAAFPTWLYRITCNSASNLLAKRKGSTTAADHDAALKLVDANPDSDPVGRAIAGDLRERVTKALAGLPSLMRQVFELKEVEGLSHSAIAERLGISETAAKVRLHRARKRLQHDLARDLGSDADAGSGPNRGDRNRGAESRDEAAA